MLNQKAMRGAAVRKCILALITLITMVATGGAADFDKGSAAYDSGDYATALAEWKRLADQGIAFGQFSLGVMHDEGEGGIEDDREAVKWYRLAAE